jgi:predicted metalloprotease with PDZ domain
VLVALDGLRVTPAKFDPMLARYSTGDIVELLAFRADELMRFTLKLASQPPQKFVLDADPKSSSAARRQRARWLGTG